MIKINEGPIDRIIRVIVGSLLLITGLFLDGIFSVILIILGTIGLITGLTGFCGLYMLLGIDTCPLEKDDKDQ